MPAGPIGSSWASGSWEDTAWEANTWADAVVVAVRRTVLHGRAFASNVMSAAVYAASRVGSVAFPERVASARVFDEEL